MRKTVDVAEAQEQLPILLRLAKAGNEIIIAEDHIAIARLTGMAPRSAIRVLGLHPGAIEISADFDEPLPVEFWLGQ